MRFRCLIPFLVILSTVSLQSAEATIRWTPEDARRAKASSPPTRHIQLPQAKSAATPEDYLFDFERAAWFIASLQVSDTLSANYGGIREGEHLPDIIQTDNTSESIWIFTRYYDVSGNDSILTHLDASWDYVLSHPAYNEEGGDETYGGYYRYYNCGWALRAGLLFEEVLGDTSHRPYVDSCANYLSTHTLSRLGQVPFLDNVNPPVLAWGAGNLRRYGEARGDSLWLKRGWRRGQRAKGWVEGDPSILGTEEWAMSGGAVMWGLLESYFREFPAEESLWVATYSSFMDTLSDPGTWENAWQGWYAFGEKRLEESTGDPIWGNRHLALTDYLVGFDDTDQDGGIMANPAENDTMDQGWVTAYLGVMCLDLVMDVATGVQEVRDAPRPHAGIHITNSPNPFNPVTTIGFDLGRRSRVKLTIHDVSGQLVDVLVDRELSQGRYRGDRGILWRGVDRSGRPVASGAYFVRLQTEVGLSSRRMILVR